MKNIHPKTQNCEIQNTNMKGHKRIQRELHNYMYVCEYIYSIENSNKSQPQCWNREYEELMRSVF